MEDTVAQLMNEEILKKAARFFSCDDHTMKLLGDFENYVYQVEREGNPYILRLTHSSHRLTGMVNAELDWLNYLAKQNISVARPLLSNEGNLVEVISMGETSFTVALFEKAPGGPVKKGTDIWGSGLFRAWGETIGKIHQATKHYHELADLPKRLAWDQDDLLDIESYLPSNHEKLIKKTKQHVDYLKSLTKDSNSYGLIHGDIHPGNFFVYQGKLTVFDFDDAMYHWFVSDIAIALYYSLFWVKEQDWEAFTTSFMSSFLEGYRQEYNLDREWIALIPAFLKLRDITLYAVFHKKIDMEKLTENEKSLLRKLKHRIENELSVVNIDFSQF